MHPELGKTSPLKYCLGKPAHAKTRATPGQLCQKWTKERLGKRLSVLQATAQDKRKSGEAARRLPIQSQRLKQSSQTMQEIVKA